MRTAPIDGQQLHSSAPGMYEKSAGDGRKVCAYACEIEPILGPEYVEKVINFVRQAIKNIEICAYTWKWYEHQASTDIQRLNYAIIEKARSGLPIRAIFNHEAGDHPLSTGNTITASKLRRYGVLTKHDGTKVTSHLKMFLIDDDIAIIGSHNLTTRSVSQNNETSVAIRGREAVRPYRDYFEVLWNG